MRQGVGFAMGAAAIGLLLAAALPASAQVLSIGDDGAVTTYSGPQVFTSAGATRSRRRVERPAATPAEVSAAIQESAARHAVPAPVVEAVAWQESRYNQAAVSPKGARGVMQLMPATAVRSASTPQT
jgi:soluble lytic murein transglycosylase-like protein